MGTNPVADEESLRRKSAIEDALRAGFDPFLKNLGGKGSSVQEASRTTGLHSVKLTRWVRRQMENATNGAPNFEPDWSLFRAGTAAAIPREDMSQKVAASLRSSPATIEELSAGLKVSGAQVLDGIETLKAAGVSVLRVGERFEITRQHQQAWESGVALRVATDKDNRLVIGALGDNHAGSKYSRTDVAEDLFTRFERAGVEHVFHTGNWIDGEASFNRYDLDVVGIDAQCKRLAETWPQREGITTHAVWGDDHEGWYAQREGIDAGRYAEATFRNEGRDDWRDLGFMESHVEIVNANSGKIAMMAVVHPGGGSAYALSYKPQKIIESLEGGSKPAILLLGHYHKLEAGNTRNVWYLQTGCVQDQTPFMRKKSLEAHVGGAVINIEQDPRTGAIIEFQPAMRRYFNKGYYAGRDQWSKHGPVQAPPRSAGGV